MLIRILALLFFGSATLVCGQKVRPAPTPSVVWMAHDPAAIHHYQTDPDRVRRMVNRLVMGVTGQPDVGRAWSTLVSPNDKVGIKISGTGGGLFTTHRDVVNAIVDGLVASGYPRGKIIVWDRGLDGIKEAGYRPESEGYQLRSIVPRDGYDAKASFSSPLMGKLIWGDLEYIPDKGRAPLSSDTENTSDVSHFCRILSTDVTKVINVAVLGSSEGTGLAGCLYNMTIPNVDNWRRFCDSSSLGTSSIAEIYANPIIARKVVLNVMDGLVAQYAGGPEGEPNYAVHDATLMASRDPVAIDSLALAKVERWRANAHLPPIGAIADYIRVAPQLGIGNANSARIELRTIER